MKTKKTLKMTLRKTVEDDLMLERLKVELGINTKARALLHSAHLYLELRKKFKSLEDDYNALEKQNNQIKNAIKSKLIANNYLSSLV